MLDVPLENKRRATRGMTKRSAPYSLIRSRRPILSLNVNARRASAGQHKRYRLVAYAAARGMSIGELIDTHVAARGWEHLLVE
jgi:hypothetical protein